MAMIATSESTALMAIRIDARTGRSTFRNRGIRAVTARLCVATARLINRKTSTGMPMDPITPNGSRRKILISSQVRRSRPCSMGSIADTVAGEAQEHVLERRDLGAEIDHRHAMLGQAVDDRRHQIVAAPADGD